MQIATIRFNPCTGFGTEGRAASIQDAAGNTVGTGYGATDDEAVAEALMDSGLTLGQAYDIVDATIRNATIVR